MIPIECYLELSSKSTIGDKLGPIIQDKLGWIEQKAFLSKKIDKEVWEQDPFFNKLSVKYNLLIGILHMPPNTLYRWHTDSGYPYRKLGINMLISNSPSHCLFANDVQTLTKTIELHYQPNTYYIFNTKQKHMVVNLDTHRYMLSVVILGEHNKKPYTEETAISYYDFIKDLAENYE